MELDKLTATTFFTRPEGEMIVYTHTLLDASGNLVKRNTKESFIVMPDGTATVVVPETITASDVLAAMEIIKTYLKSNKLVQVTPN